MRPTQRIPLQARTQSIRTERGLGLWRLWLSYNTALTCGTFIELHDTSGRMERVTLNADGTEDRFVMKEKA